MLLQVLAAAAFIFLNLRRMKNEKSLNIYNSIFALSNFASAGIFD